MTSKQQTIQATVMTITLAAFLILANIAMALTA